MSDKNNNLCKNFPNIDTVIKLKISVHVSHIRLQQVDILFYVNVFKQSAKKSVLPFQHENN